MQNSITVLGIAVGIMVLIAALSLTNGFSRSLIDATLRASPHLTLASFTPSPRDTDLEHALTGMSEVQAFTPFLADKALLTRPASLGRGAGVDFTTLFGVTAQASEVLQLSPAETALLQNLKPGQILLGSSLAQSVGAFTGETVRLLNSQQRRISLEVAGLFHTGNYLIDSAYAFTSLSTLQGLQQTTHITGYQIRLQHPDLAPELGRTLTRSRSYSSVPWQNLYGTLLDQLALQKKVIGFVVFLIVVVAAFGIANVLTLTVFEKTQEIAILRAIGAGSGDIIRIFLTEGVILGLAGLLLGDLLGLGISAYFTWRPFQLPGDLYFISSLPVEVRLTDILWVNAVGLITTLLAALLPARRAAAIEPARMIR
ncbi:ABC transporter permease [Deinococcus sp. KNUC1210]|uniref:FtsX-like permease family protein n=1 Tax=Deinococcus sp. KNUC1210 TaxID=2917691 RepID=UPI001EF12616|nr:FtsX-like permease family protein [Deinococcus sp. KNUC1210]ULH16829.1 ABC transporter permease [Deinococcus sp. KNUC1210]